MFTKKSSIVCIIVTKLVYTINVYCITISYMTSPLLKKQKIGKESHQMKITDIKIRKLFDDGPMKAIASVTFDGQLAVHDIKVINARDKFFIVMPSRKNADESYRDIVHPINSEFRAMLEKEVIEAYNSALISAETQAEEDASIKQPV